MQEVREKPHMARIDQTPPGDFPGVEQAFYSRVRRVSGCWEWQSTRNRLGYGMIHLKPLGKARIAHRVAFCLQRSRSFRSIDGLVVRHKCDNRACVRPDHLLLGTQKDNVADTWSRNRAKLPMIKGEGHWSSKLTADDVREIRRLAASGELTQREIGERFGVVQGAISAIHRRVAWSHVA